MDSENQLCRDQKGNCRSHGSRWRYKCYKVSCQNNRVEIINASKIDHIGAQEDLMILKKNVKLIVDIIIIFFWQNAVLKIRKVILFTMQVMNATYPFISSPKRKFQVSFSDLIKICPLSVVVVINSSHFHLLLLQNHWADFNFTWHKVSLDEDNSSLSKWRVTPSVKGR